MDARREFIHLISGMDADSAIKALEAFDIIAGKYSLTPIELSLTPYRQDEEPVLTYYIESCRLDGIKESTLSGKTAELKRFLSSVNVPVGQITPLHCRAYLAMVSERRNYKGELIKAGRYNTIRSTINAFFAWCVRERIVHDNPMDTIRRKREIREVKKALSEYELEKMRRAAKTEQEKLMLEIMVGTGCRISELRLLRTGDFDFRAGRVLLNGVKTSEYRESITNGKMEAAYDAFMAVKRNGTDYLFASERWENKSEAVSCRALEQMFRKIVKRSGIKRKISPHDMRRTFCTMQVNGGTGVITVSKLLGHKSLEVTQRYYDMATIDFTEARKHTA